MRTETRGASASGLLTSLKAGKKPPKEHEPHEAEAPHQEQEQVVADPQPAQEPQPASATIQAALTVEVDAKQELGEQAPHEEQAVTDLQPTEQQPQAQPEAASDQTAPAPESPSSIGPILDKKPLDQRAIEFLALVDRIDRQKLCEQLDSPFAEFNATINRLAEAKVIKDDAITKTVYLLPTEEEKKGHAERVTRLKGHQDFIDLLWILDHRSYRADYPSWDEFLHHELCVENPHDWWEKEKCRVRIQQKMDELGVKFKVPLNKDMSKHLNKVRNDPALFVSCVREFQALPQNHQIAKRLSEIIEHHLNRRGKLTSLRQFVPDATEQESAALAPIHAADQRWRNWYPGHTTKLQEREQASGRSKRDCMLEVAQESKALPTDKVLFDVARGAELEPLVSDLKRMLGPWEREQKNKAEIDEWQRQGRRLGIYKPQGEQAPTTPPTAPPSPKPHEPDPYFPEDEGEKEGEDKPEKNAVLYDVDLSGDFRLWAQDGNQAIGKDDLAKLLQSLAKSLSDGTEVTQPSSITIRRAVRQEQST